MTKLDHLILLVQGSPMLYDTQHKDFANGEMKKQVWRQFGRVLEMSGDDAKEMWNHLKDTYINYIQSPPAAPGAGPKRWYWANKMEIFRPFLAVQTAFNIPDSNTETIPESTQETGSETIPESTQGTGSETIPESTQETGSETIPESTQETGSETIPESTQETGSETIPESTQETGSESIPESTQETGSKTLDIDDWSDSENIVTGANNLKIEMNTQSQSMPDNPPEDPSTDASNQHTYAIDRSMVSQSHSVEDWIPYIDTVDCLFLSYAEAIKQLPQDKQEKAKIKLAQMLMEDDDDSEVERKGVNMG